LDAELLKYAPKDVLVRVGHARLLMAQGDSSQAINQLQGVVADAADSAQAHYFLAMAYWQSGSMARASSELQAALKDSSDVPMLPLVLEALARLSLRLRDPANAQIYASELVQKAPANPGNRQLLAEALAHQGRLTDAEAEVLIAKQLAPNDPTVHLGLAQIYSTEKKWLEAQKEFEVALQLDPHGTTALGQFADFLVAQSQSARATTLTQQYISINPNDSNAHEILGALYFSARNYGAAKPEFERAIQLNPNNMQAYLRLGKVFEVTEQSQSALAQYQKALDLQPKLAPLATLVGNLYLGEEDLELARKYYDQALSADPNFPVAIANIAWLDAQEGKNLDIALGMAQKAKSLMPEVPSITDTLGWVMYKRGSFDSAVPLLEECVQKSPESAKFRFHLGMTLLAAGQKNKGKAQLETAMRLNLDTPDAQQARLALGGAN
jgi:tetratricopeptide (TPR) repeat protein